jgi:dipeptidyl-peptidase 4
MVRSSLVCTATLCLALPLSAQTTFQAPSRASSTATALTVDRIFKTGELRSAILPETHWLRDGVSFIDVRQGSGGGDIVRVDAVTGKATVLVSATALVVNGKQIDIEDVILSGDETKALLFHSSERVWRQNTKGQYAVVDFVTKKVTPVSATTTAKMFAKFSPDARSVAYVRDNNLYVWDLAAGTERRLTTDGSANIINGTTNWVYEEEFDLRDAFRWSPDGTRIAFWRFDQSAEPVMTMENLTDSLYPTFVQYKYPKAGQPNAITSRAWDGSGATRSGSNGCRANKIAPTCWPPVRPPARAE